MDEGVEAKCPCHETEGDLLSVFPVGAGVGWIIVRPVLDELPEGLGVFFVLSDGIGAGKGVDEGEAVRFPNILNIHMSLRGGLLFFPPKQSPAMRRLLRQKPRAPRSNMIIGNLRPMFLSPVMPNGRKACFTIFVGEVFEFAIEEAVGFFDGDVTVIIRAGGPRPYGWKKFGGMCFTPLGVGVRIRRDIRFEPISERTGAPCVLRGLQADESSAEAEGVGEAKG